MGLAGRVPDRGGRAEAETTTPPATAGWYEMPESPHELLAALGRLSPKQRAALILHYYADLPVRDIAHAIGSSPATVRVHLSQGRKRLRGLLEGER